MPPSFPCRRRTRVPSPERQNPCDPAGSFEGRHSTDEGGYEREQVTYLGESWNGAAVLKHQICNGHKLRQKHDRQPSSINPASAVLFPSVLGTTGRGKASHPGCRCPWSLCWVTLWTGPWTWHSGGVSTLSIACKCIRSLARHVWLVADRQTLGRSAVADLTPVAVAGSAKSSSLLQMH